MKRLRSSCIQKYTKPQTCVFRGGKTETTGGVYPQPRASERTLGVIIVNGVYLTTLTGKEMDNETLRSW